MGLAILFSKSFSSWTDFPANLEAKHLFRYLSAIVKPAKMASSQIPISYAAAAASALGPAQLPKKLQVKNKNGASVSSPEDKGTYPI